MASLKRKTHHFTDLMPTRHSLLQRATQDSQAADWEELHQYYEPFVKKILIRLKIRPADLPDVQQQVFLRLWKGLGNYKKLNNGSKFRNWLSTLIRRTAIDWYHQKKHQQKEVELDGELFEEFHHSESEVEQLIEKEWQKHIVSLAMEQLQKIFSGNALEVLALTLEGKSAEEISEQLQLRKESVYVLRSRVRNRLTKEVQKLRLNLEGQDIDD